MLLSQPIGRMRLLFTHACVCISGLFGLCACVWLGLYWGIHTNSVKETITPQIELGFPLLPFRVPIQVGQSESVWVPLSERVTAELFLTPTLNLFAFGFAVLGFSVMCSSLDRFRWRTIGIVVSLYVVQLLLYLLSKAAEFTQFCANFTILSCYQPDAIVQHQRLFPQEAWTLFSNSGSILPAGLGPLGVSMALVLIGLTFYAVACYAFERRDLPAPL
jgi:ABC-2 type transport system permease protein